MRLDWIAVRFVTRCREPAGPLPGQGQESNQSRLFGFDPLDPDAAMVGAHGGVFF